MRFLIFFLSIPVFASSVGFRMSQPTQTANLAVCSSVNVVMKRNSDRPYSEKTLKSLGKFSEYEGTRVVVYYSEDVKIPQIVTRDFDGTVIPLATVEVEGAELNEGTLTVPQGRPVLVVFNLVGICPSLEREEANSNTLNKAVERTVRELVNAQSAKQ